MGTLPVLSRVRGVLAFAASLALMLAWPIAALGAAFGLDERQWDGCSGLVDIARTELGAERTIATEQLDWAALKPQDGLLLVGPDHALDGDEMAAFLTAGGRVAVLDDFGPGDRILARFGIERVPLPAHPAAKLRDNPALAIAEPASELLAGHSEGVHPIVADVQRIVTNHATGLRHPKLAPVLRVRGAGEPDVVLALAGVVRPGRLFAMGDPSVVVNQMLRYPGNRAFAVGLVKYLVDDDPGKSPTGDDPGKSPTGDESVSRHGGKLYIVGNRFTEAGAFDGANSIARQISAKLREAADGVRSIAAEGLPVPMAIGLAAAAALGVGAWTAMVAARPYRQPTPRYARKVPLVAQGGVAGRAAVLAARTTAPALAMLELKSALEEGLAHRLGFQQATPTVLLLEAVRARRALDEEGFRTLKDILLRMANVETSVAAGQPLGIDTDELTRASEQVNALLAMAEGRVQGAGA